MRRAVMVVFLLSLALVPVAQANGGVIDSVSVVGDGVVGAGPVDINISLIGVGGANSASVNWSATLSDLEGGVIDSDNGNALVDDGVVTYIETMLGNAPLGLSNLSISLSGDIGVPGANQWTTYYTTIHRLRPLNISLGSPTFTGVNSTGADTSNVTINDGDYARIDVPVINDGDVAWNGTLNLTLDSVVLQSQLVDADPDSAIVISFTTEQLTEGTAELSALLVGPSDSDTSDNSFSTQFYIGPPPLPELILGVDRLNEPQPGSTISWNLIANNTGESPFNGMLVCWFDSDQIYSGNVSIPVLGSTNVSVSMISKPGQLNCTSDGARTSSTTNASDLVSMSSAIFFGAGHNSPSLLGGPWHTGDEVTLSMLLRNEGDAIGNASMRVEIDGDLQNGSSTTLEGGKAGEVSNDFTFSSAGDHLVNWSVISADGAVDSNLSGSIIIPVLASQIIIMDIESIIIAEDGIIISWAIDLSEGRDRTVVLNFGTITDSLKSDSIMEERDLMSGRTFGSMNIGHQDGQQAFASISTTGWTIGFGSYVDAETDIPPHSITPQVTVNPSTQPKVPIADSQVTLYYTVSNLGSGSTPQGQIVITDDDGTILNSITSPSMDSSSNDLNAVVKWPHGDSVKIIVTWHVDGQSVSDQVMVISESVEGDGDEFAIPWGGILGGLVVGMALIFIIRMKNSPKKEKKEKKTGDKPSVSKDDKIEVACPTCDRRLRVPSTYNGGVRCPECENRFDIEAKVEEPEVTPDEAPQEIPQDDLWSASDNDILECPKCIRKLKVPFDRRPAKARCPACEAIFEARAE
jgi:hypothetical protein